MRAVYLVPLRDGYPPPQFTPANIVVFLYLHLLRLPCRAFHLRAPCLAMGRSSLTMLLATGGLYVQGALLFFFLVDQWVSSSFVPPQVRCACIYLMRFCAVYMKYSMIVVLCLQPPTTLGAHVPLLHHA